MISTIWVLGVIAFFMFDHIVGIDMEESGPIAYWTMAAFWFISVPILMFKWLKDRKSFVEKSSSDKHR